MQQPSNKFFPPRIHSHRVGKDVKTKIMLEKGPVTFSGLKKFFFFCYWRHTMLLELKANEIKT